MDIEFDRRWRLGESPFDGITIYPTSGLELSLLREVLITILSKFGVAQSSQIFKINDWHQHDGYISNAVPTTWEDIRASLESDEALSAAMPGDDYVRLGIFTQERTFYLRCYVQEETKEYGDFDLTYNSHVQGNVADSVAIICDCHLQTESAKSYFDRIYSG